MISLNIYRDLCPCKSGKLIKDCACLTPDNELIPKSCNTSIKNDNYNYSHPKCYASALNNCSKEISREHYVSKGILEILNKNNDLKIKGFPWQAETEFITISPNALASKVLCINHNSALAPLDSIFINFFNKFIDINEKFNISDNNKDICLFNGNDIERALLKILCGSLSAKILKHNSKNITNLTPSLELLKILYGIATFPKNWGLYFTNAVNSLINLTPGINFASLSNGVDVYGCIFCLHGFNFILAMTNPPENKSETLLYNSAFRPKEFYFHDEKNKVEKLIMLGWKNKGENKRIEIAYKGKTSPI